MKILKKSFFFSLCFILASATFLLVNFQKVQAAENPVQLYYGMFKDSSGYGLSGSYKGNILIKNIGSNKKVSIHYCYKYNQNNWKDTSAQYIRTLKNGYELWRFETPCFYQCGCILSIKYEVNGKTYWDNNNGKNYYIGTDVIMNKPSVLTLCPKYKTDITGTKIQSISGNIALKNLNYKKIVRVRISEDNWKTYTDIDAKYWYSSKDNSVNYWNFNYNTKSNTKKVQFAVCYEVNGTQYWDNNFGSNYTLSIR